MPEQIPEQPTDPEDLKLLTLARSTRVRTRAAQGACVRDLDGRTYAGASVELPSLRVSGVGLAVAMAASSGAAGLEAVAVVTDAEEISEDDLSVVRDFGGEGVPVFRADARAQVQDTVTT
jgi:hypothetical protein